MQTQPIQRVARNLVLGFGILSLCNGAAAAIHPLNETGALVPAPSADLTPRGFGDSAIISNGTVTLGVHDSGELIVEGVGLTYNPTGGEALAPGCWCEAWGVADVISATSGFVGQASSPSGTNMSLVSFSSTADTALSVVNVADIFEVTHDYRPSSTPNLYQVDVRIENISDSDTEVLYRRAMDWDVPPTEFSELVTIITGGAADIIFTSDNGFATGDPLTPAGSILFEGEAIDSGPTDHGAVFDFNFGTLAPGEAKTFTIYYGAAEDQDAASAAVGAVGAEAVSYGKPDPSQVTGDDGAPNTFIFAFAGVGGTPIGGGSSVPVPAMSTWALISLALVLAYMGISGFRRFS